MAAIISVEYTKVSDFGTPDRLFINSHSLINLGLLHRWLLRFEFHVAHQILSTIFCPQSKIFISLTKTLNSADVKCQFLILKVNFFVKNKPNHSNFWPRFYIVVLGIAFFSGRKFFPIILFWLLFVFSIWTFILCKFVLNSF